MDLSTIEGLDLTDEQKDAIIAQAKADIATEVLGLKTKNDELLGEKREAAEAAAEAKRIADEAKQEAELEKARKANDLASLETTLTEKFNGEKTEHQAKYERLLDTVKSSKQNAILSELATNFISPEAAKLVLKSLVGVTLDDDNQAIAEFKGFDGSAVATDTKSFIEWAGKNEHLSALMKPIDSAGGGANGSTGLGVGHKAPKDMNSQERIEFKQRDPAGFKKAFNL